MAPTGTSPKRPRRTYGDWELDRLEAVFSANSYPDREQRNKLAKEMSVSPKNIQIWFQNRRARARLLRRKADGIVENPIERMRLHWGKTPTTSKTCIKEGNPIRNDENKPPSIWNSLKHFQKLDEDHSAPTKRLLLPITTNTRQLQFQELSSEDSRSRPDEIIESMSIREQEPAPLEVDAEVVSCTNGQCHFSVSNLSDISNSSFTDLQELDMSQSDDVFTKAVMTLFSPNIQSSFHFDY